MPKSDPLKNATKEAPAAETEAPKDEAAPAVDVATDPAAANDAGDVSEVLGTPDESPPKYGGGEEPGIEDDKRTGAVDPETGEPKISNEEAVFITGDPGNATPELLGAAIIKGLDHLASAMTAEVRTRQPELFQVFQLFAAERPSILERQKRLQLRQNQG